MQEAHSRTEGVIQDQTLEVPTSRLLKVGVGDVCKVVVVLGPEDHGKVEEGRAAVAAAGRYATVKKRSYCVERLLENCCSCRTCRTVVVAVGMVDAEVVGRELIPV